MQPVCPNIFCAPSTETTKGSEQVHPEYTLEERTDSSSLFTPLPSIPRVSVPGFSWPPKLYSGGRFLSEKDINQIILKGAVEFQGSAYTPLFAKHKSQNIFFQASNHGCQPTSKPLPSVTARTIQLMTLDWGNSGLKHSRREHPSMRAIFGRSPGTITLNYLFGLKNTKVSVGVHYFCHVSSPFDKLTIAEVYKNIYIAQKGLVEDATERQRRISDILSADDKFNSYDFNQVVDQIDALTAVLSRDDFKWEEQNCFVSSNMVSSIRYYQESNQVRFFQKVLLSLELYHRLCPSVLDELKRQEIIRTLDPQVAWSVFGIAKCWIHGVEVQRVSKTESNSEETFKLHYSKHEDQMSLILQFTSQLQLPLVGDIRNLPKIVGKASYDEEARAMAQTWLSHLILPGPSVPRLMMKVALCVDQVAFKGLSDFIYETHEVSGLQIRGYTYWSSENILGKTLAPMYGGVAGWIGPCLSSEDVNDLHRVYVLAHAAPVPDYAVLLHQIKSRSNPSGLNPITRQRLSDYVLPVYVKNGNKRTEIELQSLRFHQVRGHYDGDGKRAEIVFINKHNKYGIELSYDVWFIAAEPCYEGPHPLHRSFTYLTVACTDLLSINQKFTIKESILAIEAFGPKTTEVFVRAWCSRTAHSAIVVESESTCIACGIRMAYAAGINVVILID